MQRRRLVTAATLVVAAAITLSGCSNNTGGSEGGTTLKMLAISDNKAGYDPIIAAFEKANPGVTVNISYGTGNDFESTMNTQFAAGNAPDIVATQPGIGNLTSVGAFGKKGYLLDLSDQSWAKDIPEGLKTLTDYDGKTLMYPEFLMPLGPFYNTQAMESAGLEAPTTWSGVLQFCEDAKAKGKIAYSLGLSDTWVTQLVPYALAATLVYGENPDWNEEMVAGKVTFPDSAWKTVEQRYLDMDDAGCFPKDPNGISYEDSLTLIANGDALADVQVGGILGHLQEKNTDVEYEFQPLPATDVAADTQIPASLGVGLGINAQTKNKDLALKFVNYVADEKINDYVSSIGGGVPAIPNDTFDVPESLTTFNDYVKKGDINPFPDTGWPNPAVQAAHFVGVQNMFLGKATPEQVLQSMQDAVKQ